ncbi:PREDICTED: apoptosis-inducing factor 2-like [Priapulus caudatus]|uniref:Ferroptosis suppressor protein 1 n=1 Tax=Priapulus caudatus TaxID=37621 RepID=A0ABM1EC37_PRICU|nr:PREDICTED: apoptosis-inducing factor 2-like [Priapulus caudatus]
MISSRFLRYSAATAGITGTAYLVYQTVKSMRQGFAVQARDIKDTHVVVIGGGYAGISCASELKDKCKYTLIDAKDKFHHNWGAQRASIEEGFARQLLTYMRSKVVNLDPGSQIVKLENGNELKYDYLVLATGTGGSFPGRIPLGISERMRSCYDTIRKRIMDARSVVIVGGGAAGVEMAGDIKEDFTDKTVTLVHPSEQLVDNDVSDKFQGMVKDRLKKLGVAMVLGERVVNLDAAVAGAGPAVVKTDAGREIPADFVIKAIGLKVHSVAYANSELGKKMDNFGRLPVNEFLQVDGYENVFAAGDCNNVKERKMGMLATQQGTSVGKSILSHAEGKALNKYSGGAPFALCIGRTGGVTRMPFFGGVVLGDWVTTKIKAKDCCLSVVKKQLGVKD